MVAVGLPMGRVLMSGFAETRFGTEVHKIRPTGGRPYLTWCGRAVWLAHRLAPEGRHVCVICERAFAKHWPQPPAPVDFGREGGPVADARLRQLAGAVIAQAVLTGREDGFHYSVPYGQAGCQALRELSDYLTADREQGAP